MDNENSPPPTEQEQAGGHTEKQKMPRSLTAMLWAAYVVMAAAAYAGQVPAIAAVFLTGNWANEDALTLVDALTYDRWQVHEIVAWSAAAVVALVLEINVALLLHLAEWRRVHRNEPATGLLLLATTGAVMIATLNYTGHGAAALGQIGAGLSIGAVLLYWVVSECRRRDKNPDGPRRTTRDRWVWRWTPARILSALGLIQSGTGTTLSDAERDARARKLVRLAYRLDGNPSGPVKAWSQFWRRFHVMRSDAETLRLAQRRLASLVAADTALTSTAVAGMDDWQHTAQAPNTSVHELVNVHGEHPVNASVNTPVNGHVNNGVNAPVNVHVNSGVNGRVNGQVRRTVNAAAKPARAVHARVSTLPVSGGDHDARLATALETLGSNPLPPVRKLAEEAQVSTGKAQKFLSALRDPVTGS